MNANAGSVGDSVEVDFEIPTKPCAGGVRVRGTSVVDPDSWITRFGRACRYDAAEAALAAGRPLAVAAELAAMSLPPVGDDDPAWADFGAPLRETEAA